MFSHLSEKRFPKDRARTDVGPGYYEVPSSLDASTLSANLNTSCNRFEDMDMSSFSIFVDEDTEKAPKTPRSMTPRSGRKPFGKSTKENIISSNVKAKSLGAQFKAEGDEDLVKRRLLPGQAKDRSEQERIKELQKTVEELENTCRAAQTTIAGLEARKAESSEDGTEAAELMRKLKRIGEEKEHLHEHLEAANERVQALEHAAAQVPADSKDLAAFVETLVMHELVNPRKVLELQRKVWEDQVKHLQEQTDRLEQQVENRGKLHRRQEEEALTRAIEAERRAIEAEGKATAAVDQEEELTRLRAEMARLKEVAELSESKLQSSQLEEQRLKEVVIVTQDAMSRFREREAELAGHTNHQQKIRYTMKLKKESDDLRSEVFRLQKELYHQPHHVATASVATQATADDAKVADLPVSVDDKVCEGAATESW